MLPLDPLQRRRLLHAIHHFRFRRFMSGGPKVRSRLLRYKRGRGLLVMGSSASLSLSLSRSIRTKERRNETDVTTDYEMRFVRWKFGFVPPFVPFVF